MANFASINGVFTGVALNGDAFTIRYIPVLPNSGSSIYHIWSFVPLRTNAFEITVGATVQEQAQNALSAISADVANDPVLSGIMTVSSYPGGFAIEANEYGWEILEWANQVTDLTFTEIAEVQPGKDFQLVSSSLAPATTAGQCGNVQLSILSNDDGVPPFTWVSPALSSTTTGQTTFADVARQAQTSILDVTIEDSEGDQATLNNIQIPPIFTASFILNIVSVGNAGGLDSTVTIFMSTDHGGLFNYSYSLTGGLEFQSSNVFSNVLDGEYTAYIYDGLGCVVAQTFTVDAIGTIQRRTPYELVQAANSLRFVNQKISKFKTYKNTLYNEFEYLGEFKPNYNQLYEQNDGIVTTQFRSNYDGLSTRVLDCNDNIISTYAIEKKSNNLDSRQKMDSLSLNLGNNQTGLYFISGNIFDPASGNIIDTYVLNGSLPEWGVVGNTVIIDGQFSGSFVIKKIQYDETLNAKILVIDNAWTSGNDTELLIVDCTFDRLNYETYEFYIDMSAILPGVYKAQVLMEDSLNIYPDISYISEYFEVAYQHSRTNYVEYSKSKVTGIDYTTGFIGKLRLASLDPYNKMQPGGEIVAYKDSLFKTEKLKDVSTMEGVFFIQSVPLYMVEKIRLALSHSVIEINGEEWINEEIMEVSDYDSSALRNITVHLRKVNYEQYGTDIVDIDGTKGKIITRTGAILQ